MATEYSPQIVTNGLVLCLDAANPRSYVSGSTNWFNLANTTQSGSLINGPTFSTGSLGAIVFDGINDRLALTNDITLSAASDWTLQTWIQSPQTASSAAYLRLLQNGIDGGSNYFFFEWNNRFNSANSTGTSFAFQTGWTPGLPLDRSTFLLTMIGRSGFLEVYSNTTKTTVNATLSGNLVFNSLMNANNTYPPGGSISVFSYYNRALSATEIQQNFNALRGRYGI